LIARVGLFKTLRRRAWDTPPCAFL
jgi:hypothetical protein